MLARRLTILLPEMTLAEAIETTRIHCVAGLTGDRTELVTTRPFRAPHHTISDVGLIGGGQVLQLGERSLAHHGVLFLDELPEFRSHVLEVLRQPLEKSIIYIQSPARHGSQCFHNLSGTLHDLWGFGPSMRAAHRHRCGPTTDAGIAFYPSFPYLPSLCAFRLTANPSWSTGNSIQYAHFRGLAGMPPTSVPQASLPMFDACPRDGRLGHRCALLTPPPLHGRRRQGRAVPRHLRGHRVNRGSRVMRGSPADEPGHTGA
jgi:Magnesium chelatase, subunit ChlI